MRRTNLYFDDSTLCRLKTASQKQGVSYSEFVRTALEERLNREGYTDCSNGDQVITSMLRMAAEAERSRAWKTAPADMGINHDYYIYLGLKEELQRGHAEVEKWEEREQRKKQLKKKDA